MAKTKKQRAAAERKRQSTLAARAARDRVTIPACPWDHGAMGQANRIGLVVEERGDLDPDTGKVANPNKVTGARRVDMLEIYLDRGVISVRGHTAGQALRHVWLRTEIGQCAPWLRERVDSTPKPDAAIAIQIDRITALHRIARLVDPSDEGILDCVCRQGAGVGAILAYRWHNHGRGLAHLSAALERLADRMERA